MKTTEIGCGVRPTYTVRFFQEGSTDSIRAASSDSDPAWIANSNAIEGLTVVYLARAVIAIVTWLASKPV